MRIVYDEESASDLESDSNFAKLASALEAVDFFQAVIVYRGPGEFYLRGLNANCGYVHFKPLDQLTQSDIDLIISMLKQTIPKAMI